MPAGLKDKDTKYDYTQTREELYNDLLTLRNLININKKNNFCFSF